MGTSNTVWVVASTGKAPSFEEAASFGTVRLLTEGYLDLEKLDIESILRGRIGRIVQKDDFILLAGNKLVNALALHYAIEKWGTVKVLHYDGAKGEYKLKVVNQPL